MTDRVKLREALVGEHRELYHDNLEFHYSIDRLVDLVGEAVALIAGMATEIMDRRAAEVARLERGES